MLNIYYHTIDRYTIDPDPVARTNNDYGIQNTLQIITMQSKLLLPSITSVGLLTQDIKAYGNKYTFKKQWKNWVKSNVLVKP